MEKAVAVLIVLAAIGALGQVVGHARNAHRSAMGGSAGKRGFLQHRRNLREIREKGTQERLRDQARHEHRMREKATGETRGPGRVARGAIRTIEATVTDLGPKRPRGAGFPGGVAGSPPRATRPAPASPRSPAATDSARALATPPERATARYSWEDPPVTTPAVTIAAIEDVLSGIDRRADAGRAGNVHAKRRALAELAAVEARVASAIRDLKRSMQEEGLYGPEITDPMDSPADMAASASRALGEVDSVILGLLRTPAGELAGSGYQVPDREELSEGVVR